MDVDKGAPEVGVSSRKNEQKEQSISLARAPCALKETNQQVRELKHKALQLALGAQRSGLLFVT